MIPEHEAAEALAAVKRDGVPLFSSASRKWMPRLAFLFVFPALVFVTVNLIEWLAGNDGGASVFGSALEGWTGVLSLLVGGGPLVALVLILAPAVRVQPVDAEGHETRARIELSRRQTVLVLVTGLLAIGELVWLLSENGVVTLPDSWDIW